MHKNPNTPGSQNPTLTLSSTFQVNLQFLAGPNAFLIGVSFVCVCIVHILCVSDCLVAEIKEVCVINECSDDD